MLDLYLSELRRFRNGTAIYALANLVILTVLGQIADPLSAPLEIHLMMVLLYGLSGLGLALYQFGTYRQPSRWIWLQHRPLHRARILAAIVLAALTIVALAVALPLFVFLAAQDRFTLNLVDARYYAGAAWLALQVVNAWLLGAYIMLQRSRWAFLAFALPWLLTMHLATGSTMLALALACNGALLMLVYTVFRPDRQVHGAGATLANALALQAGFYGALLMACSMIWQVGMMIAGAHPNNKARAAPGGYVELIRLAPHDALRAGLAASSDPRAAAWRTTLQARDMVELRPRMRQFAVRGLVTNFGSSTYATGGSKWTFSHDRMMYHGLQQRTLADQGWMGAGGPGDTGRFASQPQNVRGSGEDMWLVDVHNIYAPQAEGGSLRRVLHIASDEQAGAGIGTLGTRTLMLTNRRLLILDDAAPQRLVAVALPVTYGDLSRVEAAQVADGMLLSFVAGARQVDGVGATPQVVYLVGRDGGVREVARRELGHDFPALFEHLNWWMSPALHALTKLPDLLIDNGAVPDADAGRFAPLLRVRPPVVWTAALLALLAAGLGALWWTRRTPLPTRTRAIWCLACLLLGLPALLTLMVLRPRVPVRVAGTAAGGSATVAA